MTDKTRSKLPKTYHGSVRLFITINKIRICCQNANVFSLYLMIESSESIIISLMPL